MISITTKDKRIFEAVKWGNKYFHSQDFTQDVLSLDKYEFANCSPEMILECFQTYRKSIDVKCTDFGFFYRKVLGKTIGNGFAYVNSDRLNRPLSSIGATCVHEASHVVDEWFPQYYFGHGTNSAGGKEVSFPYYIGTCAEKWIEREVSRQKIMILTNRIERLSLDINNQRIIA